MHQGDASAYVKFTDLHSLRQKYKHVEHREKNDKHRRTQISAGGTQAYQHEPKW
jgi:hypothetical protein